ncbi:MAG: SDR family NAD(P)-dependent oxidoreductase [Gammaproteobacteria bacterium]
MIDRSLNRRQLIAGGTAMVAASTLAACSGEDKPIVRPKGVPLGPYGAESTAMQVVEGLDLRGKTALITGANSGLGHETMRVLASRGAHILCAARTRKKRKQPAQPSMAKRPRWLSS